MKKQDYSDYFKKQIINKIFLYRIIEKKKSI